MREFDPYRVTAGPQLDTIVHTRIIGRAASETCPPYSTSNEAADLVKMAIESKLGASIICGETNVAGKGWFARAEAESFRATEVLAETYPLAICSLALVLEVEALTEPSGMGSGNFEPESSSSSDQLLKSYAATRLTEGDVQFEMPESTRRILNSAIAHAFPPELPSCAENKPWWNRLLPRIALAFSCVVVLIFTISLWRQSERKIETGRIAQVTQTAEQIQPTDIPGNPAVKAPQGRNALEPLLARNNQPEQASGATINEENQPELPQNSSILLSSAYKEPKGDEILNRFEQNHTSSLPKQQIDEPSKSSPEALNDAASAVQLKLSARDQLKEKGETKSEITLDSTQLAQERPLIISLSEQTGTTQELTHKQQVATRTQSTAIQTKDTESIAKLSISNTAAADVLPEITRTILSREISPSGPTPVHPVPGLAAAAATTNPGKKPAESNEINLSFSRSDDRAKYRRNFNSPPPPNILSNFEVRFTNDELSIIDSDGSTYRSKLKPEAAFAQENELREPQLGAQPGKIISFDAHGTNISLKQNVVFSGKLFFRFKDEIRNEPTLPSLKKQAVVHSSESEELKTGAVIQGRASIGKDEIRIEAHQSSLNTKPATSDR